MRLSPPQSRLRSLDVYRGITIAAMILVNDPGAVEDTYPALLHAPWTGWTFADTIFPAFLWIIGVSITLSTAARLARGDDRGTLLRHGLQRSALLFLIGIALSDLTFPVRTFPYFRFEDYLPLTGVLQKIAVCYLAATAIFLWTTWRGVIAWIIGLSAVYVALMSLFTVPNCNAGTWTVDCNFAGYIDRVLLEGHLWRNDAKQDPDGLGSLLPAITSVLFGVLAGYVLKADARPSGQVGWMLMMAGALMPLGLLLSLWIPISKPLWTPSFAIFMAGLSSACMAFWIWVADLRQWVRWLKPLEIFGMNAIAAYIVSIAGMNVAKIHFSGKTLYDDVCRAIASPENASLIYAALHVLGVFLVVWFMYRKRWFLRI